MKDTENKTEKRKEELMTGKLEHSKAIELWEEELWEEAESESMSGPWYGAWTTAFKKGAFLCPHQQLIWVNLLILIADRPFHSHLENALTDDVDTASLLEISKAEWLELKSVLLHCGLLVIDDEETSWPWPPGSIHNPDMKGEYMHNLMQTFEPKTQNEIQKETKHECK